MKSHHEFGATIGQALVELNSSEDVPRVACGQFVKGLFDIHSNVKLPTLLGNKAVREWMERTGVSESMLRVALTDERRTLRQNAQKEPAVRVAKRKRTKRAIADETSNVTKPSAPASERQIVGVVPNRSLDLL